MGSRGSRLAGPCRGRLEAGKAVRSVMGDPGEPRSFQEYISPSGKKSVTLMDLVGSQLSVAC